MSGSSLIGRVEDVEGSYSLDNSGNIVLDQSAANASNYGVMQARIIDEMEDAQTAAQVQNAIQDAIRIYERERFWFNELFDDGSLKTSVGREFYSGDDWLPIATRPHIDRISLIAYGTRYMLSPRDDTWMEERAVNPTFLSMPTDWSYAGGLLRLYPLPNDVYSLRMFGTQRFPALSATTDANCWTIEAERLIRAEAKRLLYLHVVRDVTMAQAMAAEVAARLSDLRGETFDRGAGPRRIRPRQF